MHLLASSCLPVCHIEQLLENGWTDFHEIWYLGILLKFVNAFQVNSDQTKYWALCMKICMWKLLSWESPGSHWLPGESSYSYAAMWWNPWLPLTTVLSQLWNPRRNAETVCGWWVAHRRKCICCFSLFQLPLSLYIVLKGFRAQAYTVVLLL
jgi:hypothetical protein